DGEHGPGIGSAAKVRRRLRCRVRTQPRCVPRVARVKHLILIGLMGAGKTTVGKRCADRLDRSFVDTDDVVVSLAGMPVDEVFATFGEPRFRELERSAVGDVAASPAPLVIACGGGTVLDPDNR